MGKEELKQIKEVLKSGVLSGFIAKAGPKFHGGVKVQSLEKSFRDYFAVPFAIAVNSATSGLHAAIAALGIGPGDEVIVPPYTMSASATAILMHNAIPVFCDITEDTFCIDPQKLESVITERTKAIIVVHLFGHPADMDAITVIAQKHGLKIIEDCAQAPAALYKNKLVGTLGDIAVFSFNQNKIITSGEGGVIVTPHEQYAHTAELVRNHGEVVVHDMGVHNIVNTLGWNYRMTELEAAVALAQFKKLDDLTAIRIRLADYVTQKLSKMPGIITPQRKPWAKHVYFTYPIRILEETLGISRQTFIKALAAEGIPLAGGYVRPIYFEPVYAQKLAYGTKGCPFTCSFYGKERNYPHGLCPVTERLYAQQLATLGVCRFPMKKKDMNDVADAFEKVINNIDSLKKAGHL